MLRMTEGNMNNKIYQQCATLGQLGYLPAPGTWGSLAGLAFAVLLKPYFWYPFFVAIVFVFSFFVIQKSLLRFNSKDPSQIIIDEVVGILSVFLFVSLTIKTAALGFCLFRYFDISKFGPVGWVEKAEGSFGVLVDDIVAGILAGVVLHLFLMFGLI